MHIDIHVYLKLILDTWSELRTWYHLVALLQHFKLYLWFCRFNKMSFFLKPFILRLLLYRRIVGQMQKSSENLFYVY